MTDKLHIATWNVRGLGDTSRTFKQSRLKTWVHRQRVQVVLLQETKLDEPKIAQLARWWAGPQFWDPANGTRGGTAILIHREVELTVLDSRADIWGQWVWVKFRMHEQEWVIMSVYAPAVPGERRSFFAELPYIVPDAQNMVVAGDFNTVLHPGLDSPVQEERKADARLLLQFMAERDLTDTFRQMNPEDAGFTWFSNQLRDDQPMAKRRLDLILAKGVAWESTSEVQVATDSSSDHKPVSVLLRLESGVKREAGAFRLNTENLKNPAVLDWCKKHWEEWERTKDWFGSEEECTQLGFRIITRALDAFSRILAKGRNKEELDCIAQIEEAEDQMGRDPLTNIYWERRRVNGIKKLEGIQIGQQEVWARRAKERGMAQVDRMTKETFRRLCPPRSHNLIRALQHPFNAQADLAVSTADMCQYAADYYTDILTSRRPSGESLSDLQNQNELWQHTTGKLSQQQRLSLDRPLTLVELKEAIQKMARGKSPGDDGLPIEFFEATWEQVGPILLNLFNGVLEGGRLTKDMCRGVITLLYKKGDKLNVRNWRPISLLNVAYKILAKALSRRIGQYLTELVKSDQGAFVKGRSIAENLMVAMGMYRFSTATVLVNGRKFQEFALTRSLRQGCPLAPLLFVLQIEVVLNAATSNRVLKGLELREGVEVKTGAIADDLLLITEATSESMGAAKSILDQYSVLSEAKVNWDKSVYFLPEEFEVEDNWSMKRIRFNETERYLGLQVSLSNSRPAQDRILLSKVEARTKKCNSAMGLSLMGRAAVISTSIFSLIWHIAAVILISRATLKQIRRVAARYLWKPGEQEDTGFISKVSWDKVTQAKGEGGLGIVDPERQNVAMLGKWLQKISLQEEERNWMLILQYIPQHEFHLTRKEDVWLCIQMAAFLKRRPKSALGAAWCAAWSRLRPQLPVAPVLKEDILMQHLFENPNIMDSNGCSFEVSGAGNFGKKWIEKGVSRIKDLWDEGQRRWTSEVNLPRVLGRLREVGTRLGELLEAIPADWKAVLTKQDTKERGGWYKVEQQRANPTQVLRLEEKMEEGVWKVTLWEPLRGNMNGAKLRRISEETMNADQSLVAVRVCLQPGLRRGLEYVLIQGGAAILDLRLDPARYSWQYTGQNSKTLVDYDTKLGRRIQKPPEVSTIHICERLARTFNLQQIPSATEMKILWASLPYLPSLKLAGLLWLMSHSAVPSAKWLGDKGMDVQRQCLRCGNSQEESTFHLIWDCPPPSGYGDAGHTTGTVWVPP
ncbi:hypothetical protein CBR_g17911 [Chara braunii]|uniref:Reverse transcriptase domain-containing protein n=1 Tax=Chara braunii TaxID=69332 RepID=A0A388KVW1_CHABU|nr:hypothetical protein CBR_g17911 [Chara braunii]|eukprot:GBG74199.1 hypothetical protein CBR_g17911 [Chara braunii]